MIYAIKIFLKQLDNMISLLCLKHANTGNIKFIPGNIVLATREPNVNLHEWPLKYVRLIREQAISSLNRV